MTLGDKILQLRKASGLSQEQLGERLGVSRQAISKWELNESVPDIDKLVQLGTVFSISLDELLKGGPQNSAINGETKDGGGSASAEKIARKNPACRIMAAGIWTVIAAIVASLIEALCLPVVKITSSGASQSQTLFVPLSMAITGLVLLVGTGLIVYGSIRKKRSF